MQGKGTNYLHHFVLVHLLQGPYYILELTTSQHNIEPFLIELGKTKQIIETQMLNKIIIPKFPESCYTRSYTIY